MKRHSLARRLTAACALMLAGHFQASGQQLPMPVFPAAESPSPPPSQVMILPVSANTVAQPAASTVLVTPALTLRPMPEPTAEELGLPASTPEAQVEMSRPRFPRGEAPLPRRSFVDLTAAPCFSRAPDYNWIIGQVEFSQVSKEWRLRYASVDETDRYGGRLSLIENHHVGLLRDGMYIHVRGHLVNPDNPGPGPTYYRIDWFRAVENPNLPTVMPTIRPPTE